MSTNGYGPVRIVRIVRYQMPDGIWSDGSPHTPNWTKEAKATWGWPIRGVRVEGDTVIVSVKGGNDAARWLCGEILARCTPAGRKRRAQELAEQLAYYSGGP